MQAEPLELEQEAFRAAEGLLDGRVVILTGATGGIGATIARMLVRAGARAALTDLAEARVAALASELHCFGEAADVSSLKAFGSFHERVILFRLTVLLSKLCGDSISCFLAEYLAGMQFDMLILS